MWGECEMWVDCKCMELLAAGCCTRKWLRFDQTIRNLTSGDLEISFGNLLVVSQLRVTGLKNTRVVYLLDFFEGIFCLYERRKINFMLYLVIPNI